MSDEAGAGRASSPIRDAFVVYGVVLALVVVAAVVAIFVSLVASLLYAIVAFLFFFVPQRILERRGEDPAEYGMTAGDVPRGLLWGIGASLLTVPFFLPGYYIWETVFLERDLDVDFARYRQWSVETEGEPRDWGRDEAGVWVWSERDVLHVGIRNDGAPNNRVVIEADEPFVPVRRGTLHVKGADASSSQAQTKWIVTLTHSTSRGEILIRGPDDVRVEVEPVTSGNPAWPMYRGAEATPVDDGEFDDHRGLWWLALWMATQLILVAFPEEYFYRGFLQTRLEQGFERRADARGVAMKRFLGFTPAIFVTSVMFGIGHLIVPVGGTILANRMSVFFPSLLFGWLRRKTGSILAPTIYHAFSNMLVLVSAVHFV